MLYRAILKSSDYVKRKCSYAFDLLSVCFFIALLRLICTVVMYIMA